jgi:hypothetical protein
MCCEIKKKSSYKEVSDALEDLHFIGNEKAKNE